MSMKIYEYAVIHHPIATKEQQDRGEKPRSELIVDVTRVLARDDKEASQAMNPVRKWNIRRQVRLARASFNRLPAWVQRMLK
jgi:hypothetical protein